MASYYIGVDSGGTSTRALLADHRGRVLGAGYSGSANRNHHTRDQVRESLRAALKPALDGIPEGKALSTLFLGMSGVSTERDRREIESIVRELPEVASDARLIVENDTVVGLTGGLAGRPGLALIAGTGSACFGINGAGERWLCGGWGALADDVGSAPWVGLCALQAAVRAEDGRAGPTALRQIVFDYLGLEEPRQFIDRVHNPNLDRADLGNLAPLVVEACRHGDATAAGILRAATVELSALASVTARRLFGSQPCEAILVGGLARSGPPFQTMLTERLCRDIPALQVFEPDLSPVHGAVMEALRADGVAWTDPILANLAAFRPAPMSEGVPTDCVPSEL